MADSPRAFDALPPRVLDVILGHLANRDLRALAHAGSRSLLARVRHARLYHLWPLHERMFIENPTFRASVAQHIPLDRLVISGFAAGEDPPDAVRGVHGVAFCDGRRTMGDLAPLRGVREVRGLVASGQTPSIGALAEAAALYFHGVHEPCDLTPLASVDRVEVTNMDYAAWGVLVNVRVLRANCRMKGAMQRVHAFPAFRRLEELYLRDADLTACANLSSASRARKVALDVCRVSVPQLSALAGVRHVSLLHSELTAIPACLRSVRSLDLSHSRSLVDVSEGGNVHTLILRRCDRVRDVSRLGRVHVLVLAGCRVPDVSALGRVHTLDLSENGDVLGTAMLGGNHTLNLSQCVFPPEDAPRFGRVHSLNLESTGVADVSSLGGVHTLKLARTRVADVWALGAVRDLDLRGCALVRDVRSLGQVGALRLDGCEGVEDVSLLVGVRTLTLDGCVKVRDVSALGNAHTLSLEGLRLVTDVSALGRVHTLNLRRCGVVDVAALGGVHTLSLASTAVVDVSALGHVHNLNLSYCEKVADVSSLARVHTLDISNCPLVSDVTVLSGVRVLCARNCPATMTPAGHAMARVIPHLVT